MGPDVTVHQAAMSNAAWGERIEDYSCVTLARGADRPALPHPGDGVRAVAHQSCARTSRGQAASPYSAGHRRDRPSRSARAGHGGTQGSGQGDPPPAQERVSRRRRTPRRSSFCLPWPRALAHRLVAEGALDEGAILIAAPPMEQTEDREDFRGERAIASRAPRTNSSG